MPLSIMKLILTIIIDYTFNHVLKTMTASELNTHHTVCELERTQLLTILAMSVKNPQLSNLYIADTCYDRIPIH